jgi:hypothetical protein
MFRQQFDELSAAGDVRIDRVNAMCTHCIMGTSLFQKQHEGCHSENGTKDVYY